MQDKSELQLKLKCAAYCVSNISCRLNGCPLIFSHNTGVSRTKIIGSTAALTIQKGVRAEPEHRIIQKKKWCTAGLPSYTSEFLSM